VSGHNRGEKHYLSVFGLLVLMKWSWLTAENLSLPKYITTQILIKFFFVNQTVHLHSSENYTWGPFHLNMGPFSTP